MIDRIKARIRSWRATRPWLDHAIRAYDRNTEVMGTQLAAAITYFGFLSFFPLLALGFSVVGYISDIYPSAQADVTRALQDAFPSLVGEGDGQINVQDIINAKANAGVIALLGLAYAGMGWLDALRDGLRRIFATSDVKLSLVKKKLVDVVVLVLLGLALLGSLVATSMATAATTFVLDQVGLDESPVSVGLLKVISVAFAVAADTVLFAIVFSRLSGAQLTWRQVRSGALLAAVGFELLKLVGTFLIGRTTQNPLYATFGVVVGLLVWMNFVARLTIIAAAWTATQPYSLEPADLGEAGAGRRTGLAVATEPLTPVAPGDYELAPVGQPATPVVAADQPRRTGWRRAVVGATAGAGLAAWLMRSRRSD
jgi:membrane protein